MSDDGLFEQRFAGWRELVVAAGRTLFLLRDSDVLPRGRHQALALEATQNRINGPARELSGVEDVKAMTDTVGEGVKHQRCRLSKIHWPEF